MLARSHRFHGHNSVRSVYRQGRVVRSGLASLHYLNNPKRRSYRMAVVVSRKVDKSAVARNRMRRRVYEIVRTHSGQLAGPADLVFTLYDGNAATLPAPELAAQILQLMRQAGVLAKPAGAKTGSARGTQPL